MSDKIKIHVVLGDHNDRQLQFSSFEERQEYIKTVVGLANMFVLDKKIEQSYCLPFIWWENAAKDTYSDYVKRGSSKKTFNIVLIENWHSIIKTLNLFEFIDEN